MVLTGGTKIISAAYSPEPGQIVGKRVGLVIERLRVRIRAGAAEENSSPELILCADSRSMSVPTPLLPQWHVKDPGHSAKSAGGRLDLKTHISLTQRSRNGLTMSVSRHNVGTYPEAIKQIQQKL